MTPFFTIVIPTKNRPYYLRQAIQSVLWQDFENYELIVSDNFNGEETQEVIKEFSSHPHFVSYRTGEEMNMIDHWEWATKKAQGKYVIVLPDRKLLFQGALKKIFSVINKYDEQFNIYSYAVRMFDEDKMKMGYTVLKEKDRVFSSSEMIDNFLHRNIHLPESFDFFFPKTLNSCYKNEFATSIRSTYNSYFNNPDVITPDYSSLMVNLAMNQDTCYIASYLILTQGEKISNGRLFAQGNFSDYLDTLGQSDPLELLPLKIATAYNLIVNDFLRIKNRIGGNLSGKELDLTNYFVTNYTDIVLKKRLVTSQNRAKEFEEHFWNTLQNMPAELQQNVKAEINQLELIMNEISSRQITRQNFKLHAEDFLYVRLSNRPFITRLLKITFKNSLHAAGFGSHVS